MTQRDKARRRYNESLASRASLTSQEECALGSPLKGDPQSSGSHVYLDKLIKCFSSTDVVPSKVENVFCGYWPTASSQRDSVEFGEYDLGGGSAPLIKVGPGVVRGMIAASAVFMSIPHLQEFLLDTEGKEGSDAAQDAYGAFRASACRYILNSFTSVSTAEAVPNDRDLFAKFQSENDQLLARGAMAWVVAHELGHLAEDGSESRKEDGGSSLAALEEVFLRQDENPPPVMQRSEYAADVWSLNAIMDSPLSDQEKYQTWPASIIMGLVMGLAEYENSNGSIVRTIKDSHPNPFRRSKLAYLAFASQSYIQFQQDERITNDIANAYIFTRIIAGEYGHQHRGYQQIFADHKRYADALHLPVKKYRERI